MAIDSSTRILAPSTVVPVVVVAPDYLMPSSPPGTPDALVPPTAQSAGGSPQTPATEPVLGAVQPAVIEDSAPTDARARDEVTFLLAEADAATDKAWASRVYFEAGYLQESALGLDKAAARTYAKSLTSDPTFQPTAWALRRQLGRQGHWENLIRVIEAEARFASNTRSQDRADLLVERGLLLSKHMQRPAEGAASFGEAVAVDPKHRAGWIALLQHALWHDMQPEVERAFEGLLATSRSSAETAAWTAALSQWLLLRDPSADLVGRSTLAASVLLRALSAGVEGPSLLATLDRYSLAAGHEPLRVAVLDAWDAAAQTPSSVRDASRLMALREKARRLVKQGELAAAAGTLQRALQIDPDHPVVAADRLDLAVIEGRMDAFDAWQAHPDQPLVQAELLLRRADMAMRQGAWGEAMGALGQVPVDAGLDDLCFVERVRTLAGLQDAHGLAEAYEAQADNLLARVNDDERKGMHEVAHQYVRAGAVWESELADSERAETLYSQALALVPSYRPAQEGLASVFTREGRWEKLVELVASDAAGAATSTRASTLRESLVLLNRDLLHDLPAALASQSALIDAGGEDIRSLFRCLDIAALLSARDGGALDTALHALARLTRLVRTEAGKASLWLLSARLAMGSSRDSQVDSFLDQALTADAMSLAAAFIERKSRGVPARVRAALAKEFAASVRLAQAQSLPAHAARVRALRYRQAFVALEANQFSDALSALDPLVRQGDVSAWCWQVDILRRLRDPALLRKHLAKRQGATDVWLLPSSQVARAELHLLLGESCELAGRRDEAAVAFEEAAAIAEQTPEHELAVRCLLGCLRMSAATTNIAGTLSALMALSGRLQGPLSQTFAQEAQQILLATGGVVEQAALLPHDDSLAYVAAARSGDPQRLWSAMHQLATQSEPSPARSRLWFQLAVNALTFGNPDAAATFRQAYEDEAASSIEIAVTELPSGAGDTPAAVDPLFSARLARLTREATAGDKPSAALATLLALERGSLAESEGRLGAAAAAYALVLELRPDSLEALEGLRRLAQLAGVRLDEALLLERIGDLLISVSASAAHYAEAALLVEADGKSDHAIGLFYKVLSRAPNDDEAFERLLTLLRAAADWSRVENLLGFKLTRLGHKGARCVPLWRQRAIIRFTHLGDKHGAYADWQRLLAEDPHIFEALWRLGQASRASGAAWAARARLHEASQCDCDDELQRLECFVDLAEVCESQNDTVAATNALQRASGLLGVLNETLWLRLLPLCTRLGLTSFAEQALRSLAAQSGGAARAVHLLAAAHTLRDAERLASSVALVLEAMAADPHCDGVFDLASMPPAVADTEAVRSAAALGLEEILKDVSGDNMFDVRSIELLEGYAKVARQSWRQVLAAQLLFLLGQGHAGGVARNVVGVLDGNALLAVAGPAEAATEPLQRCWPLLCAAVCKVWLATTTAPAGVRAQRIDLQQDTRLNWFSAAATCLGLKDMAAFTASTDVAVNALSSPEGALALGPSILGGDAGARFRAGRALALAKLGLPCLIRPQSAEPSVLTLFCATLAVATSSSDLIAAAGTDLHQRLQKQLPKKTIKSLSAVWQGVAPPKFEHVAELLARTERAANRFGLIVSGDIAESAAALAGTKSLAVLSQDVQVRSLVAFALTDEHHLLRQRLCLVDPEMGTHVEA